jgi:hypothetical protein
MGSGAGHRVLRSGRPGGEPAPDASAPVHGGLSRRCAPGGAGGRHSAGARCRAARRRRLPTLSTRAQRPRDKAHCLSGPLAGLLPSGDGAPGCEAILRQVTRVVASQMVAPFRRSRPGCHAPHWSIPSRRALTDEPSRGAERRGTRDLCRNPRVACYPSLPPRHGDRRTANLEPLMRTAHRSPRDRAPGINLVGAATLDPRRARQRGRAPVAAQRCGRASSMHRARTTPRQQIRLRRVTVCAHRPRGYVLPSRWRRSSASMKASRSPSSTASTLPVS